ICLTIRTVLRAPVAHPPLQCPELARLKAPRVSRAEPVEQRQRLETRLLIGAELGHDLGRPHIRERILACPPAPRGFRGGRQRPSRPPPRGRPPAAARGRARPSRLAAHPLPPNPPYLRIGDQPSSLGEKGQSRTPIGSQRTGKSNCRRPANLIVVDHPSC